MLTITIREQTGIQSPQVHLLTGTTIIHEQTGKQSPQVHLLTGMQSQVNHSY